MKIWTGAVGGCVLLFRLQDSDHWDLFDALKYTADSANGWFRSLYAYGVWIPGADAAQLVKLAWGATEPLMQHGMNCTSKVLRKAMERWQVLQLYVAFAFFA